MSCASLNFIIFRERERGERERYSVLIAAFFNIYHSSLAVLSNFFLREPVSSID